MNDGHILVIIIEAFVVVQTIAVGVYKYLRSLADLKMMEAASIDVTLRAREKELSS
jgi:hypothetical protein